MNTKAKILVVEDDAAVRQAVTEALKSAGYAVTEAADGDTGLNAALADTFDLLLLDIILPGISGTDIGTSVQTERPGIPIIYLTAKGSPADQVKGLNLGADDYIPKPYDRNVLLARIEAVLRRSPGRIVTFKTLQVPAGSVDMNQRVITFKDGSKPVSLTRREFELLFYLASHAGKIVSRDEILQQVWKINPRNFETRTIDMTIARLRERIRDKDARVIQTVRSRGYQFARLADDGTVVPPVAPGVPAPAPAVPAPLPTAPATFNL